MIAMPNTSLRLCLLPITLLAACATSPAPVRPEPPPAPSLLAASPAPTSVVAPAAAVPTVAPSAATAPAVGEGVPEASAGSPWQAEADRARQKHPWELVLSGAGANDRDFDAGGLQFAGSIGYYFTEVLELSLRQNVSMSDAGSGRPDLWDAASRIALDVHFPMDGFVPYVGVNVGYVYGDTLEESLAAGPEAGFKFYLKPETFLLIGVEYEFFFDTEDRINDAFDEGTVFYNLGFGVRL